MATPEQQADLDKRYGKRTVSIEEIEQAFGIILPGGHQDRIDRAKLAHEHLEWCKERAREYLAIDDPVNALGSFFSDMRKNEDTAKHGGLELGAMLMMGGFLNTVEEVRDHIEGYNG